MKRKKHKRKTNHVIIVTSDAVDANVKQYRIHPWIVRSIVFMLCVLTGAVIGYILYEERIWENMTRKNDSLQEMVAELEIQNQQLETEVVSLNNKISILSETVNQKVQAESELSAQLEKQSMPTEFPLTGSASIEEGTDGENAICTFTASVGTMVVATASGTVTAVEDDENYGHNIWIDHGNGYMTLYRNQGDPTVDVGNSVVQGTTLFIIGEENIKLGYQMTYEGAYINPLDMLAISG